MEEKKCILVVDDEPGVRALLGRILQNEGYEVVSAQNGQEALDIYREKEPDLLMLDISMPELDGFQVLGALRKISDVPVIMLTAKLDAVNASNAFSLGADDYIRKPFHKQELLARVKVKLRRTES